MILFDLNKGIAEYRGSNLEGDAMLPDVGSGFRGIPFKKRHALPPQARSVFVLHHIEGLEHREIGALLGIAEGTCKAQLHRARQLLARRLQ